MDLAVCGLTISRSVRSMGEPERQMTFVLPTVVDPVADFVFHLHLVLVGQDDDAGLLLVLVGDHQFRQDGEDLRRPAQDEGMPAFEHARAALAQFLDLAFHPGGQHTDQGADDEDAADGDEKHDQAETPAGIAAHRAGVEGAHQAFPGGFDEGQAHCCLQAPVCRPPRLMMAPAMKMTTSESTASPPIRARVPRDMKLSKKY